MDLSKYDIFLLASRIIINTSTLSSGRKKDFFINTDSKLLSNTLTPGVSYIEIFTLSVTTEDCMLIRVV